MYLSFGFIMICAFLIINQSINQPNKLFLNKNEHVSMCNTPRCHLSSYTCLFLEKKPSFCKKTTLLITVAGNYGD